MLRKFSLVSLIAVALLGLLPSVARATEFTLKLEPGLAIPLSDPQADLYDVGGGQSIKALFGLTPFLDVGPSASFLMLPASASGAEAGVVWGLGAGLRLKRPHDEQTFEGVSPWFDADFLYVRTGELNRTGVDAALGVSAPVGDLRAFWIGPFVRYLQVFQPDHTGFDNHDAKILTVGLSLEVGSGVPRPASAVATCPANDVQPITKEVFSCPDRDGDGVPDSVDRCPDVVGTSDNWGCPEYKKIVVRRDKLELKEKLYFAWDQATLEAASFPVLDEVVQALKDNKTFQVQVEGHADSSGPDDHNQTLSEKRAAAVLEYLAAHGVAKDRLSSKGFSSSVPIDTNATVAGRENNRRVEFVVNFTILNAGSPQ
jgi:outer membrane protein OmpA-like peptidoglycan-associated protein